MSEQMSDEATKRSRVQIHFKSGLSMVVECDDFTVKHQGTTLTSMVWESATPKPMYIDIGEVESVWEIPAGENIKMTGQGRPLWPTTTSDQAANFQLLRRSNPVRDPREPTSD